MLSIRSVPRSAFSALGLGFLLSLAACGGGSSGAAEAATGPGDTPTGGGGGGGPTVPPGFNPDLDPILSQLAQRANAGPLPKGPSQNPDRVELGRMLFFDRVLSGNRNISCYTCHDVGAALGDALSVSIGTGGFGSNRDRQLAEGLLIPRNSPPLFRMAGRNNLFLDGRVSKASNGALATPEPALNGLAPSAAAIVAVLPTALAAQAMFPVTSREEMRGQPGENEIADAPDNLAVWAALMRRLVGTDDDASSGIPAYREMFARAYPGVRRFDDFNFGHAAQAIASFEVAGFSTTGAPFDAWLAGSAAALTDDQKRGGILFYGRANCATCHGGPALSDDRFHAIGVPQVGPGKDFPLEDTGRGLVTGFFADRYRFRTPSLRNVEVTGPFMHDGAYTSLEAAVRHYVDPSRSLATYDRSQLSPLLRPLVDDDPVRQAARAAAIDAGVRRGVALSDIEVGQILAFLRSLTDATADEIEEQEPDEVPSGLPIDDE